MVNKVILIGNVGGDPNTNVYNGTKCSKFSLATNESWKGKDGEFQTKTEWHNVVCWAYLAEKVENSLSTGDRVYIEGKIESHQYEKDGDKRRITQIIAEKMRILYRKNPQETSFESNDSVFAHKAKLREDKILNVKNSSEVKTSRGSAKFSAEPPF